MAYDDEYQPSASKMIQDYVPLLKDKSTEDYYIKTVDKPVAVHVFNRSVVIVGNDGTVLSLTRR